MFFTSDFDLMTNIGVKPGNTKKRKSVILKPKPIIKAKIRQIVPVLRKVMMKDAKDEQRDMEYWLSRPVQERAAAVTFIISQSLKKGQRMDKTKLVRKRLGA